MLLDEDLDQVAALIMSVAQALKQEGVERANRAAAKRGPKI